MVIEYAHFSDVVTFDTTCGTNKEYRPFDVFVDFNHGKIVVMNIKYLPGHNIFKQWTREARSGTIQSSHGNIVFEDPRSEDRQQLKFFMHEFLGIASQAITSEECIKLVE
jgi:hypothetical protein